MISKDSGSVVTKVESSFADQLYQALRAIDKEGSPIAGQGPNFSNSFGQFSQSQKSAHFDNPNKHESMRQASLVVVEGVLRNAGVPNAAIDTLLPALHSISFQKFHETPIAIFGIKREKLTEQALNLEDFANVEGVIGFTQDNSRSGLMCFRMQPSHYMSIYPHLDTNVNVEPHYLGSVVVVKALNTNTFLSYLGEFEAPENSGYVAVEHDTPAISIDKKGVWLRSV